MRSLFGAVSAIGLAVVLTQSSCLALLCYEDESCADGSGGGSTATASVTASQASTAQQATAVTASQGPGGGAGGGPCEMSTLLTDTHNCGECGHDCFDGDCSNGMCQPFSIDLDGAITPMGPIAVWQDRVWAPVVTAKGPEMLSVPFDFDESAAIFSSAPVLDIAGKFGVGAQRLYYTAQGLTTGAVIYHCDPTLACELFESTEIHHFVGVAAVGDRLYVTVSQENVVGWFGLDDGVPVGGMTEWISSVANPAGGIHEMFADPSGKLVFTTFGNNGCVYRKDPINASIPLASCDGNVGMAGNGIGALASDPVGTAYIATQDAHPALYSDAILLGISMVAGEQIRAPIAVDDTFIYARSATSVPTDGLVILNKLDGSLVQTIGSDPPGAIDATHPEFVYFSKVGAAPDQSRLYRLRKPVAPRP